MRARKLRRKIREELAELREEGEVYLRSVTINRFRVYLVS